MSSSSPFSTSHHHHHHKSGGSMSRRIETEDSLSIHEDMVVKEGSLQVKQRLVFSSWKVGYFVMDGSCLMRVKPPTQVSSSPVSPVSSPLGSSLSPVHRGGIASTSSPQITSTATRATASQLENPLKSQQKHYQVTEKFWVGAAASEQTSPNRQERAIIVKAVDGEPITGKKCTIGLFFDKRAPLVLRANDSETQEDWIRVLSGTISRNQANCGLMEGDSSSDVDRNVNGGSLNIHSAVEAMIDAAVITDAFGDIQCVNSSLTQLFGYMHGEMLRMNVKDLIPSYIAEKHDAYMDRFRKSGEKKLIGLPRTLPIIVRGGKTQYVVLSLGEIPGSTNSDKNRFLAVMKSVKTQLEAPHNPSAISPHGGSYPQHQNSFLSSATSDVDSVDTASEHDVASLHSDASPSKWSTTSGEDESEHQSSLNNLQSNLQKLECVLSDITSSFLDPFKTKTEHLMHKIAKMEAQNKKMIATTSHQTEAMDYLSECITHCSLLNMNQMSRVGGMTSNTTTKLIVGDSLRNRMTPEQKTLHRIVLDKDGVDLDDVLSLPLPFKHFILYSYSERAEESCKFYIYITTQYKTEKNLDVLLAKKDFVMETFVANGSQFELNLASNARHDIESLYKSDLLRDRQLLLKCKEDPDQYERLVQKEQSFFNSLLSECKTCLLDTLMRFKKHPQYGFMKEEVADQLNTELHSSA